MQIGTFLVILFGSYLIGSIPFGLLIVRLKTGQDVRTIQSGRTGGTNAMRAAGFWVGLTTAILDILKATVTVWLARCLLPNQLWLHVLAPTAAILGHNYSIYLVTRGDNGRLRFHGGAGGAPSAGGSMGLWPPVILLIVPVAGFILYFVGYASVATLSVPLVTIVVFAALAWGGSLPWEYVVYGVLAEALLAWSLRPNIRALLNGTERVVGFRAQQARRRAEKNDLAQK